jgi:hypothetical protein
MFSRTKSLNGYLLDLDTKEIVTEALVEIILITPSNPAAIPSIKGTLLTKGYTPQYNDKSYMLKLGDFSDTVRITMQQINPMKDDITRTRFDISFEGSSWHTDIKWFDAL